MKNAVNQLKDRRKCEDEFEAFGKYVATELRSLADPLMAQRIRLKMTRFLVDCIEAELKATTLYVLNEDEIMLN